MRRSPWILRIALETVIVVAAIIIGIVGGLLGRKNSNSKPTPINNGTAQSASSSPPSASHKMTLAPSETYLMVSTNTVTISRDCPGSNGTTVVINDDPPQTFIKDCGWVFALSDSITGKHTAFQSTSSALDACISPWASYNVLNGTGPQGNCSTVAWRTDVTQSILAFALETSVLRGQGREGIG